MPEGTIGFRWAQAANRGKWNLRMRDPVTGEDLQPELSFLAIARRSRRSSSMISPPADASGAVCRSATCRPTWAGSLVTTVFDLLLAQFGVSRGLPGDYPARLRRRQAYTPAWQESITGIHRDTLIRFAREWGDNAEQTSGKNMIIIGAGANHWYHNNLLYRSGITALMLTGSGGRERRRAGALCGPGKAG